MLRPLWQSRHRSHHWVIVASIAETLSGGVKRSGFGQKGGIKGRHCYTVRKNASHLTA
jgi:acyl-CoA reductase-like NAD-dependent aldehyde dehydrogenase